MIYHLGESTFILGASEVLFHAYFMFAFCGVTSGYKGTSRRSGTSGRSHSSYRLLILEKHLKQISFSSRLYVKVFPHI